MTDPLFLLLLILVLISIVLHMRTRASGVMLPQPKGSLPTTLRMRLAGLPFWLRILALCLLIVALARPSSQVHELWRAPTKSVEIMLVLDCSGSMKAKDYILDGKKSRRLEAVRSVILDFIDKRPDDALGLILFGESAMLQCPLTLDHTVLKELVNQIEIDKQVSGNRTAIGTALLLAADRLRDSIAKSKVIVLLTDGDNNAGIDPLDAAQVTQQTGAHLFVIGAGGKEEYRGIEYTDDGRPYRFSSAPLNEDAIKKIVAKANGTFFRAADADALKKSYATIDGMVKTEKAVPRFRSLTDYYQWLVFPAILLLCLEALLRHTWLRRLP